MRKTSHYLRLALTVTSLLGLFVTWSYFRHGLLMRGFMLDLGASFKAYLDLISITGIAVATAVAIVAFHWIDRVKAN